MTFIQPYLGILTQIIVVVAAFSALIFVHELGHYLAARLTGVRVERFFIGFDIFGLAIQKEYKGTVYGIGILPLGGYCALAGQNDDPRKERVTGSPDEFQSKSLGARALVLSGGVIMNFIFGFLILIVAFMYGIPTIPPVLGNLDPSGPAAIHGFRSGDRILKVDGREIDSFESAAEAIALAGAGSEVDVEFGRLAADGTPTVMSIRVKGRASTGRGNLNSIGAEPQRSRVVGGVIEEAPFGDLLAGKLGVGDEILAVDGKEIASGGGEGILAMLRNRPGQKAALTVKPAGGGEAREVMVPLETYGEWDLGLRIGVAIAGVAEDGPAARAGLRAGDVVVAYQLPGQEEPQRFTSARDFLDIVAGAALNPVMIDLNRNGEALQVEATPRLLAGYAGVDPETDTLLGVEGRMDGDAGFLIATILPDSPMGGLAEPGDHLTGINSKPLPLGKSLREAVEDESSQDIRFFVSRKIAADGFVSSPRLDVPEANLALRLSPRIDPEYRRPLIGVEPAAGPVVSVEPGSFAEQKLGGARILVGSRLAALQYSPDLSSTIFRFVFPSDSPYGGGLKTLVAETPEAIREDPSAAGLRSRLPASLRIAEEVKPLSFVPAVGAAAVKWVDLASMVYKVLHKLVIRTLPLDAVGGPVQLFHIIKLADDRGFPYFLYIVALISVNLGVCNLLPFPVLDGGHLVFLLLELVMGKPPSPAIKEKAQWIGLAFLLTFMATVTFFDLTYLFTGG